MKTNKTHKKYLDCLDWFGWVMLIPIIGIYLSCWRWWNKNFSLSLCIHCICKITSNRPYSFTKTNSRTQDSVYNSYLSQVLIIYYIFPPICNIKLMNGDIFNLLRFKINLPEQRFQFLQEAQHRHWFQRESHMPTLGATPESQAPTATATINEVI